MKPLIIIFLALILMYSNCANLNKNKSNNVKPDYEISVNQSFSLTLESNPTTGYSWKWMNKQVVSIVDTLDYKYVADTPILVGSGGSEIWKFKGIRSGLDSIQLEYCRPWDPKSTIITKKIIVKVK